MPSTKQSIPAVRPPQRNREMDGLRGVGVITVMHQHWFGLQFDYGFWMLMMFFVLSGFLITRSLAQLRDKRLGLWKSARIFFGRRARRLFPAYYLVLLIGIVLSSAIRNDWPWYTFYGTNILMAFREFYIPFTPTWSLSVEEQFYIFWFFGFMLLPHRIFAFGLPAMVAAAVIFRMAVLAAHQPFSNYLLPGALDVLAFGCMLAFAERAGWVMPPWAGYAALAATVTALALSWASPQQQWYLWGVRPMLIGLAATWLVWRTRTGLGSWPGALLGSRAISYLGEISYGMYLFHMLTANPVRSAERALGLPDHSVPGFVVHVLLTFAIAAASSFLLERPILDGVAPPLLRRRTAKAPAG